MSCRKWQVRILRMREEKLGQEDEAALARHLEGCARCRGMAEKFSLVDKALLQSPEPPMPPFLKEKIVSHVIGVMREESLGRRFLPSLGFLNYFRPMVPGVVLVFGIVLGIWTGLNLSRSINSNFTGSSYDLLTQAGIGARERGSSLDFIWTDGNGGGR